MDHALGPYREDVEARLKRMDDETFAARLWRRDPSLWSGEASVQEQIAASLGWLTSPAVMKERIPGLLAFRDEVARDGIRQVVHMGMGGSSLAPLAFSELFPAPAGGIRLDVLDGNDPVRISAMAGKAPLAETLFIVASKSGGTAETHAFEAWAWDRLVTTLGADEAPRHMAAITDPGSTLAERAEDRDYRGRFLNFPDIGGRYSALSYFGLVPAALLGVDLERILDSALAMASSCGPEVPAADNPGLLLGAVLGEIAVQGRDKLTFLLPSRLGVFGMWLEQLLAESTGKEGTGILPVTGETPLRASDYGADRLFARIRLKGEADDAVDRLAAELWASGHPVASLSMRDSWDLGGEFLRWEIATAVAGSILGIDPFDQPNVQESKDLTRAILEDVAAEGGLPEVEPLAADGLLRFFGEGTPRADACGQVAALLDSVRPGDYLALQVWFAEEAEAYALLQDLRTDLMRSLQVPVTIGYGPRFLHSTGQFHKGGPPTGVFLQIVSGTAEEIPIPGEPYGFGAFKEAQAMGDLQALQRHDRRALSVHIGTDVQAGLAAFAAAVHAALDQHHPAG